MAAWLAAQLTSGEPEPQFQPTRPSPQVTALDGLLLIQEMEIQSYQAAFAVLAEIEAGEHPKQATCNSLNSARSAFRARLDDIGNAAQTMRGTKNTEEDGRYLGSLVADIRQRDRGSPLAQIESLCAPR